MCAKLDRRNNDNQLMVLLDISNKAETFTTKYIYEWDTATRGDSVGQSYDGSGGDSWSLTYTGNFTQNFVAKAMYGVNKRSAIGGSPWDGPCSIVSRDSTYDELFGPAAIQEGCPPSNSNDKIGREHVCTPATHSHRACRLL